MIQKAAGKPPEGGDTMKRRLLVVALALAAVLTLTACGAKSNASSSSMSMTADSAPMEKEESGAFQDDTIGYVSEGEDQSAALSGQKFIDTADMNLETTAFDDTTAALTALAESLGGYLESSTVGGSSRGYRWADYTVRVPSQQFQTFLSGAGDLAHTTWRNVNREDITEVYYDTEGRLKTQQIKLERLQSLLAQAENMEDIIALESAISETEWNIENLSGTLRHYDAQVEFSTVSLHVQEVYKYSGDEELPENFGGRMGNAFRQGWTAFTDGLENLIVALAYGWVWVLLAAVVVVLVILALRRGIRRRRAAKKIAEASAAPTEKPDDKS